jgi:geranyl-CoA carboxylase alpha subunit
VTEYYDPMIAKVISYGRDREEARRKLVLALRRSPLLGVRHNKRFLEDLLSTPTFVEGQATTAWLDGPEAAPLLQRPASSEVAWAIAATLVADGPSGAQLDGFRNAHEGRVPLPLRLDDVVADVEVEALRAPKRGAIVRRGGASFTVEVASRTPLDGGGELLRVRIDGHERSVYAAWSDRGTYASLWLEVDGIVHVAAEEVPRGGAKERAGDGRLRAPTSGRVTSVRVAIGDRVSKGQIAVTLEAMKIESAVVSDVDGEVLELNCSAGQQVENRKVLVVIRPDAARSDASTTPANANANEA